MRCGASLIQSLVLLLALVSAGCASPTVRLTNNSTGTVRGLLQIPARYTCFYPPPATRTSFELGPGQSRGFHRGGAGSTRVGNFAARVYIAVPRPYGVWKVAIVDAKDIGHLEVELVHEDDGIMPRVVGAVSAEMKTVDAAELIEFLGPPRR